MKKRIAALAGLIWILPVLYVVAQAPAKHAVTPKKLVEANRKQGTHQKAG